jgi:mono/diheme cytochrome c family protein
LSKIGATTDKGEIMKSSLKAVFVLLTMIAVGMESGCGSSGSGSGVAAQALNTGTSAGTSSTSTPSAQLSAGAALYATNCAKCHGAITSTTIASPASLSKIKSAISANFGGMSMFSAMSDADLQSIADAVNNPSAATTTPVPAPAPTPAPTPAFDGAAYYTANCAGCHGALASSAKLGATAAQIQAGIASVGGMSSFSTLTATQIQAIATALAPVSSPAPTPTPTPAPTPAPAFDGAAYYTANCAGCHGALASSAKLGATAAQIQAGITSVSGMKSFSSLTATQIQAIAAALAPVSTPTPTPTPTPAPAFDALTYYNTTCLGCHGSLGKRTAAKITSAIASVGQMKSLSTLTAAQITAIAAVSH